MTETTPPTARPTAFLPLAAASLLLGGCATIFTGTVDTLNFDANVPGVRLTIDGQYQGELPRTVVMSRNFMGGRQFVARFEKEGHLTQEFKLAREFNTVAILDVSSTLVSGGVDVLTGSLMRFSPLDYHVQMLAEGQEATSKEVQLGLTLRRFALVNFQGLQLDLARGGGEHLAALAALAGDGDEALARQFEQAALQAAIPLLEAPSAPLFLERLDAVLVAARPELRVGWL